MKSKKSLTPNEKTVASDSYSERLADEKRLENDALTDENLVVDQQDSEMKCREDETESCDMEPKSEDNESKPREEQEEPNTSENGELKPEERVKFYLPIF